MKKETLLKIAIASVLLAPACADLESGVVICKDELPEENALYVNLMRKDKSKQKPLHDQSDEQFVADRKLFFEPEYKEVFDYVSVGDTITFFNKRDNIFVNMNVNKRCFVNGVESTNIVRMMRHLGQQKQK